MQFIDNDNTRSSFPLRLRRGFVAKKIRAHLPDLAASTEGSGWAGVLFGQLVELRLALPHLDQRDRTWWSYDLAEAMAWAQVIEANARALYEAGLPVK